MTKGNLVGATILINQTLPEHVAEELRTLKSAFGTESLNAYMYLLRDKGWTLASIAEPLGITRERVRQRINTTNKSRASKAVAALQSMTTLELDVPELPEREVPQPRETILPSDETLKRLRELQPLAAQVRYNHAKYREEAEEYVALLWYAHTVEGVSVYRLGKLMGVLACGIESRFVRYGYKETSGSSGAYTPLRHRATVS